MEDRMEEGDVGARRLLDIPIDIFNHFLPLLPHDDLKNTRLTCRALSKTVDDCKLMKIASTTLTLQKISRKKAGEGFYDGIRMTLSRSDGHDHPTASKEVVSNVPRHSASGTKRAAPPKHLLSDEEYEMLQDMIAIPTTRVNSIKLHNMVIDDGTMAAIVALKPANGGVIVCTKCDVSGLTRRCLIATLDRVHLCMRNCMLPEGGWSKDSWEYEDMEDEEDEDDEGEEEENEDPNRPPPHFLCITDPLHEYTVKLPEKVAPAIPAGGSLMLAVPVITADDVGNVKHLGRLVVADVDDAVLPDIAGISYLDVRPHLTNGQKLITSRGVYALVMRLLYTASAPFYGDFVIPLKSESDYTRADWGLFMESPDAGFIYLLSEWDWFTTDYNNNDVIVTVRARKEVVMDGGAPSPIARYVVESNRLLPAPPSSS